MRRHSRKLKTFAEFKYLVFRHCIWVQTRTGSMRVCTTIIPNCNQSSDLQSANPVIYFRISFLFFSFVGTFQIDWENICPWRRRSHTKYRNRYSHKRIRLAAFGLLFLFFWRIRLFSLEPIRSKYNVGSALINPVNAVWKRPGVCNRKREKKKIKIYKLMDGGAHLIAHCNVLTCIMPDVRQTRIRADAKIWLKLNLMAMATAQPKWNGMRMSGGCRAPCSHIDGGDGDQ